MKNLKTYEAWDPEKKEWEKTQDGQADYRSKDQMYKHGDIYFLWDYDKKDLRIIPDAEVEANKGLKSLHVTGVDKEKANDIIGLLVDHPYEEWEKILNDNKVTYSNNEDLNGEPNKPATGE